jgi:hypothetical protein
MPMAPEMRINVDFQVKSRLPTSGYRSQEAETSERRRFAGST